VQNYKVGVFDIFVQVLSDRMKDEFVTDSMETISSEFVALCNLLIDRICVEIFRNC